MCDDVDECSDDVRNDICGPHSTCINTEGGHLCGCENGYEMNGEEACVNVDECVGDTDPCTLNLGLPATCHDTEGGFECVCNAGYEGDTGINAGAICTDIDECVGGEPCGSNSNCDNEPGGFSCVCDVGFEMDGDEQCVDVDECQQGSHDCDFECLNTNGGFECFQTTTPEPTTTDPPQCAPECDSGFECDMQTVECVDIDECAIGMHECDDTEDCINTEGSFECEFNERNCDGLELDVSWKGAKYTIPKFVGGSENTVKLVVTIFNDETSKVNIRAGSYEGYLMWGKVTCGNDFIKGLADGRVTYDIMDYEHYYEHGLQPYFRGDKSLSATILQYTQFATGTKDLPWTRKFGNNSKKDKLELVLTGLNTVTFPSKFNLMDCLMSANIGVFLSLDESLFVKEENHVKCVAWQRDIFNR